MSYQNNTIEALKKLYVAMGGTEADVENLNITPEMISAIADIYEDKGDTLPAVTADDNGKLLTVVEGNWDKANAPTELPAVTGTDNGKLLTVVNGAWDKASAPAETFTANYTMTVGEPDITGTCDKTYAEVLAAFNAGKIIIANATIQGVGTVRLVCGALSEDILQFSGTFYMSNTGYVFMSVVHDEESIAGIMTALATAD